MKTFLISIYYQLITFNRVKKAVFFTFVFPVFIYVIFSTVWGENDPEYSMFLLTGIIIMTVISDALYSIGNVILSYYQNGFIKFFKVLPYSFNKYLLALIFSRIIITSVAIIILVTIGIVSFEISLELVDIGFILIGITVAFIIFSFLGLLIGILSKDTLENLGTTNFIYFCMMFVSDTFYPISEMNPAIGKFVYLIPISPVLKLIRGDISELIPSIIWIIILFVSFVIVSRTKQIKR